MYVAREYHNRRRLRVRLVVADVVDESEHHHRVVFVDHVVTVQWEPPNEIAETEIDLSPPCCALT